MREGWKYCKLGEICKLYQPKTISSELLCSDGKYFVYGANGVIGRYNQYNHENAEVLMTCRGATCGTINLSKPFSWINGNAMVVHPKFEYTFYSNEFLVYLLKSIDLSCVITGCAQPQITVQSLSPLLIPVPPIEEQQRIVTELDLLSSIIEKQKAQLKELDTLAQSIFYDMFGDPVTNEKGWEIKSLMNIGYVERGKGISKKDFVENGVPCIHYGQLHTTFSAFTTKHVSCIPENLLKKPSIAHKGDLVMAITSEDVECSCKSTAWMGDYDIIVGSDAAILHHNQNGIYLSYCTKTESFFNEKSKYAKGFKVTHISTAEIEQIPILIPPLPLQQQFADKIQSIESQKSAITKSIAETQKLFDYTMDKYFG
ncbi:MAG: restriction endonuclease subunit S [Paludibacteraceae bacterium]|nr:restriction endonuclease subunit S [Paludibacteraceae bacterium]